MHNEFRCRYCAKLLFKGQIRCVEIKCPRCGALQEFKDGTSTRNASPGTVSASALDRSVH